MSALPDPARARLFEPGPLPPSPPPCPPAAPDGAALRDAAIQLVEQGASPAERQAALEAVRLAAEQLPELITDDVHARLSIQIREGRLLGWAMRQAQRRGWITGTDRHANSRRPECHCRLCRVWRSLLRGAGEAEPL